MDIVEKRNNAIREKATAGTSNVSPWNFQTTGHLYVDDRDTQSFVGEVYYSNPFYEIGAAIKVRDWVFCLERMVPKARKKLAPNNDPDAWVIAAFHGQSHYSFISIKASSQKELNDMLIEYVVETFWPILHPEVFESYLEEQGKKDTPEDKIIKWKISPL